MQRNRHSSEFKEQALSKARQSPFLRELISPFGNSGCVALFEIEDAWTVTILAARHQLEDDYH